jgi:hypothetical protein
MRRIFLILVVAAVMAVATMALPGTAFAQSCFDDAATITPGPQPVPGPVIGSTAKGLAHAQATSVAAQLIPFLQAAKSCENP